MTRDTNPASGLAEGSSRRAFVEKGAFASLAVALSTVNSDVVTAQTDGTDQDGEHDGLMFSYQLTSDEQFRIVSEPIDWEPLSEREMDDRQTEVEGDAGRQQEGNRSTADVSGGTEIPDAEEEEEGAEGRQQEGNRSTADMGEETEIPDAGEEEEGAEGRQQEGNRSTQHQGTETDLPDGGDDSYRTYVVSFPSPRFAFLLAPERTDVERGRLYDMEETTDTYDEDLQLVAVNFAEAEDEAG